MVKYIFWTNKLRAALYILENVNQKLISDFVAERLQLTACLSNEQEIIKICKKTNLNFTIYK